MPELAIYAFFSSIASMFLFAISYRRVHYSQKPLPRAVLIVAAVLAPFGALLGQLLWRTSDSRHDTLLLILSIVMTACLTSMPVLLG